MLMLLMLHHSSLSHSYVYVDCFSLSYCCCFGSCLNIFASAELEHRVPCSRVSRGIGCRVLHTSETSDNAPGVSTGPPSERYGEQPSRIV